MGGGMEVGTTLRNSRGRENTTPIVFGRFRAFLPLVEIQRAGSRRGCSSLLVSVASLARPGQFGHLGEVCCYGTGRYGTDANDLPCCTDSSIAAASPCAIARWPPLSACSCSTNLVNARSCERKAPPAILCAPICSESGLPPSSSLFTIHLHKRPHPTLSIASNTSHTAHSAPPVRHSVDSRY
ncbi:unnamed protein product [Boreogadus saida]